MSRRAFTIKARDQVQAATLVDDLLGVEIVEAKAEYEAEYEVRRLKRKRKTGISGTVEGLEE